MNYNRRKLYSFLAGFLSAAIVFTAFLAGFSVFAAWQEPSQAPPAGNIAPPLNTGSTNQTKLGGLTIGTVVTTTKLCFGAVGDDCKTTWSDVLGVWLEGTNGIYYSAGNVGIGAAITGLPDWPLSFAKLAINTGSAEGLYISRNSAVAYSYINVRDNLDQPIFKIHENGGVGIGTDLPNKALHVASSTGNAEIDIQSVAGLNNHWGLYADRSNNSFNFWGGSNSLTILRNGNVGIGATNPGAKLEVNGQSIFGSAAQVIGSGQNLIYGNIDTTSAGNLLLLQNETVDKFRIDKDGNVKSATLAGVGDRCVQADSTGTLKAVSCTAVGGGLTQYRGVTTLTFNGSQGGYTGANSKCNTAFSGSHVCSAEEIFYSIRLGVAMPAGTQAWINNGAPEVAQSANDCEGWSTASNGSVASVWEFGATGGKALLKSCNYIKVFACCQ